MTVKGRLQRSPVVRIGGDSIRAVSAAKVLGVVVDERLSFAKHAQYIGEKAAKSFGKASWVSAASWGMRYPSLLTVYRALTLLTKTYRTTSTVALPVLAGVLPADYEVILAGRTDIERDHLTRTEIGALRRRVKEEMIDAWQKRWDELLTGHGCFRRRLHEMGLNESSVCMCGQTDEDIHHVLCAYPLYDDIRVEMLGGLEVLREGPVYYADLSRANFCRFREFARAWHRLRGGLK
ncbi:Putative 115 kDa protein in type-1 retrotransposable element R1DM [Eumeta japonica]|uniref:115 kDa protein in type-1 retrotransposable element R1DM n=1 Tax=Eumeta variegata TaxID=151549 RepID=A0A4C1S8F8_EUMVA|nr:Putative 115 kDa protein in type-1 retrotransposable element R1DM [Eumeta japonica]